MDLEQEIINVIRDELALGERADGFNAFTAFDDIPEFDSMSVTTLITALEEKYDCTFENDETSAEIFHNIRSLTKFVESKLR
ncbi:MAG: acyl carrier protein [Nitrosomonas sp.]|nr:acyl carrier protein [Nitrosomonas sp.]